MNGMSSQLTVQDPYGMTPQELARYEALFPSYAQPEDPNNPGSAMYVGGAAAVELFSKSVSVTRLLLFFGAFLQFTLATHTLMPLLCTLSSK